jgi:propanol-preferring alcohol dehydrogenase
MRAMVLRATGPIDGIRAPLDWTTMADPEPGPGEVLIRVSTCGVCHTELDEIEGRLTPAFLPIILGHQVVGVVEAHGAGTSAPPLGARVGVAWIGSACGRCPRCTGGDENICAEFRATGRDAHGGYAEFMTAPAPFVFPLPEGIQDLHAGPLLCAGAIGYRSWRLTNLRPGGRLGLTGFGASAHLVLKMVRYLEPQLDVFVFARSAAERTFARELGAAWAGDTTDSAPCLLDAIIDTTPAWTPVVEALRSLAPGGRLVINAIRKEPADRGVLATIDYPRHLWLEKEIKSVANVSRRDVRECLALAARMDLRPEVQVFGLADANQAVIELRLAKIRGAKVLAVS